MPINRIRSGCCARAESGHKAAPHENLTKSRLLITAPTLRRRHRTGSNGLIERALPPVQLCPLWVKSRHRRASNQCPLYPQKADINGNIFDVRFVP
jgi:hypothetical protein